MKKRALLILVVLMATLTTQAQITDGILKIFEQIANKTTEQLDASKEILSTERESLKHEYQNLMKIYDIGKDMKSTYDIMAMQYNKIKNIKDISLENQYEVVAVIDGFDRPGYWLAGASAASRSLKGFVNRNKTPEEVKLEEKAKKLIHPDKEQVEEGADPNSEESLGANQNYWEIQIAKMDAAIATERKQLDTIIERLAAARNHKNYLTDPAKLFEVTQLEIQSYQIQKRIMEYQSLRDEYRERARSISLEYIAKVNAEASKNAIGNLNYYQKGISYSYFDSKGKHSFGETFSRSMKKKVRIDMKKQKVSGDRRNR